MRLLITGFEPFGGESVNASWQTVSALPGRIGDWELFPVQIPTVFALAGERVLERAKEIQPDAILCVGQAAGRQAITPETIGINLRCARIADNAGNQPLNEPVSPGGPDGLFSTLPVPAMTAAIQAAGVAGSVSYSAGTYVCNDLLYTLLLYYRDSAVRVGFIHVPLQTAQAREGMFTMSPEDMAKGLAAAIAAM